MGTVEQRDFAESYLKTLNEAERQTVIDFLDGLTPEKAQLVMDTGRTFHRSSAVNGSWFWRTAPAMAATLPEAEFNVWLTEGAGICRGNWEGALSFLKAGPEIAKHVNLTSFVNWVHTGRSLIRFSNHDAVWFFKHSEDIIKKLTYDQRQLLTEWVLKITAHSWPAAVACFKTWPETMRYTAPDQSVNLLRLGLQLAADLPDDAAAYFQTLPALLRRVGNDFTGQWVETAYMLQNGRRGVAAAFFKASPGLAEKIKKAEFLPCIVQWVNWGNRIIGIDSRVAEEFFAATPQVLQNMDWPDMEAWVCLIEEVNAGYSAGGALDFVKISPELLAQLDIQETAQWVANGLNTVKGEKRTAYFTLKSQESRDAIVRLRSGLHLESVKKVLLLYLEGLTGETAILRNASDLPRRIHGDHRLFSAPDTRRIYLPDMVKVYPDNHDNLRLYRVMLIHQAAHREFGAIRLSKHIYRELAANSYLGLLFEYLEDIRVDYLAMQKYPGLGKDIGILLERDMEKDGQDPAGGHNLITFLKYFLWSDKKVFDVSVSGEIKAVVHEFWRRVVETGASARDSLLAARRLLQMTAGDNPEQLPANLSYRGRLKFDLLYTAALLDEELNPEEGADPEEGTDPEEGAAQADGNPVQEQPEGDRKQIAADVAGFNPNSDFYMGLKKILAKFVEDEENPYRLIAYYDEWDRSLNDYKKDWCKVREIVLKPCNAQIVNRTLAENYGMVTTLKKYFGMLRPDRFRRYGRQEDGEDIDIDAVIEAMIEKEAGVSPAGGFYIRRDKRERDVAVGFLLDLSYSTDEAVPNTGKTLLDVEQESVIVMAEALEVLGDKYAIYGFNSDGRDKINFYVVKDFAEAYSPEVKQRFGGLRSYGMTRLAAAVRHAIAKLAGVPAAIKILILLSDGRPFDFDYNSGLSKDYEQFYAETDTRMALREAKMKGINPFCITVDSRGQEYMEYIFGNVSYIIIDDVNALPTKLTETYKNLTT